MTRLRIMRLTPRTVALISPMCILLAAGTAARAQSVDTAFDPGASDFVATVALQPDGKILVGGRFTTFGGGGTGVNSRLHFARLNPDGSLDSSFNPGASDTVWAIAIQSDGRIVIGGNFLSVGGGAGTPVTRNHLARLN